MRSAPPPITQSRTFSPSEAAELGATPQGIADFAAVLQSNGWDVGDEEIVSEPSLAAERAATALAACRGFSGFHGIYPIIGSQWGMNSCTTAQFIAAVGMGAGGATEIIVSMHSRTPAVVLGVLATALAVAGVLVIAFHVGHDGSSPWAGGSLIFLGMVAAGAAAWLNSRYQRRG